MLLASGIFGIKNNTISLVVDLVILFLVVVWLALVYWTYADARRRIADPLLVGCAVAASLFPFVGTLVYMIVRPPEYLDDVRERDLEMQAAEARLAELGYHLCPHCDYEVERDFLRCPNCLRKLRDPCKTCSKPLDPSWRICPYCETEVGTPPPAPRRTRRRASERQAAGAGAVTAERTSETAPVERDRRRPRAAAERDGGRFGTGDERDGGRYGAGDERDGGRYGTGEDRDGGRRGTGERAPAERGGPGTT